MGEDMRRRPWPIIILAVLQLFMPILTIYLAASFYSMGLVQYLRTLSYLRSQWDFYAFFAMPVLASMAIYAVRKWSYPIFLGTIAWQMYHDLTHWTMSSAVFPTEVLIMSYVFNVLAVSYMMLPAVWSLYFNPKFAWWRSKPRYLLSHVGEMKGEKGFRECKLLDISQGGAYLESNWELDTSEDIALTFNYSGLHFVGKAKILHKGKKGLMTFGYGLEFRDLDRASRKILNQIIRSLKRLNMEQVPKHAIKKEGFVNWALHLVSTGHGLVPMLPPSRARATSAAASKKKVA